MPYSDSGSESPCGFKQRSALQTPQEHLIEGRLLLDELEGRLPDRPFKEPFLADRVRRLQLDQILYRPNYKPSSANDIRSFLDRLPQAFLPPRQQRDQTQYFSKTTKRFGRHARSFAHADFKGRQLCTGPVEFQPWCLDFRRVGRDDYCRPGPYSCSKLHKWCFVVHRPQSNHLPFLVRGFHTGRKTRRQTTPNEMEMVAQTVSQPDQITTKVSKPEIRSIGSTLDQKIEMLAKRILPTTPYLLTVPSSDPYIKHFEYENKNTPFAPWEVDELRYMTMICEGDRGVAFPQGDWQDKINSRSPASACSGTVTPRSERDPNKPLQKMSFADYKAGKRPTSSSQASVPNSSQPSKPATSQPKELSQTSNVATKRLDSDSPTQKLIDEIVGKSATEQKPNEPPKPSALTNNKEMANKLVGARSSVFGNKLKPVNATSTPQQKASLGTPPASSNAKRPLEDSRSSPQKRAKIEHQNTPTTLEKSPARALATPRSPTKNGRTETVPTKATGEAKKDLKRVASESPEKLKASASAKKQKVFSEKVLPPLLSPLPPGLSVGSPDRNGPVGGGAANLPTTTDNLVLPPLQSPLPESIMNMFREVDAELKSEKPTQEKVKKQERQSEEPSHSNHIDSVTARRERSRQPDAPGVARKSVKHAEPKAKEAAVEVNTHTSGKEKLQKGVAHKALKTTTETPSEIVKLKYGRRNRQAVARILRLTPHPASKAHAPSRPESTATTSPEKKRARAIIDDDEDEAPPTPKRPKPAHAPPSNNNLDVQKARTPSTPSGASPSASNLTSHKTGIFGTPKKATTSTTMLRSESSDSHGHGHGHGRIRTPSQSQGSEFPSAPGSAGKPSPEKHSRAMNGVGPGPGHGPTSHPSNPSVTSAPSDKSTPSPSLSKDTIAEIEALRQVNSTNTALGIALKRARDVVSGVKAADPADKSHAQYAHLSDAEKQILAVVLHVEAIAAFMKGYSAQDQERHLTRAGGNADMWRTLFPFVSSGLREGDRCDELGTILHLLTAVAREQVERLLTAKIDGLGRAYVSANAAGAFATEQERQKTRDNGWVRELLELNKELVANSRARVEAWRAFEDRAKKHHVEFCVSVEKALSVAGRVLGQFCQRRGVAWEARVRFE